MAQTNPFEITAENDPFYTPENKERLKKSIHQLETMGGTIHFLNSKFKEEGCDSRQHLNLPLEDEK